MVLKAIGVVLVIGGCGSVGFRIASAHKQEERALRQLIEIFSFMECQLQYQHTPLPQLCRQVATEFPKWPGSVFRELAIEMESQILCSVSDCMKTVLNRFKDCLPITRNVLVKFSKSAGYFDLDGQLKGLEAVRQDCKKQLLELESNRDVRIRSCQTLGLCAGAALAILFV